MTLSRPHDPVDPRRGGATTVASHTWREQAVARLRRRRTRGLAAVASLALMAGSLGLTACTRANGPGEVHGPVYGCPMLCEEEKTYDRPGTCPVCGMVLVEAGEDGSLVIPAPPPTGEGAGAD